MKINIEDFHKKYCENYDWLYNGGDQISGYDELVDMFDAFAFQHPVWVSEYCAYRKDLITSDREAAAFILTLHDFMDDPTAEANSI